MIVRRLACAAALLLAALRADAQTVRLRGTVVRLVMIAGLARYGDPQLMKVLAPNATLEPITVCGRAMLLNLSGTGQTWGTSAQEADRRDEADRDGAIRAHHL